MILQSISQQTITATRPILYNKYRLEGFDDEWLDCAPGMHHVTYTNLAPGSYTLAVKAINSDGIESAGRPK